ncbi:MAG: hypothetical protein K9N06_01210 [Candidatus Cloacimonetes bacterium]|nr:hypothetical protein [Candidatus Cloacimonadota bacterium]
MRAQKFRAIYKMSKSVKYPVFIILIFIFWGCSTINYQTGYYADAALEAKYIHSFTDRYQLPYELIIIDQYLADAGRIFLITQNWLEEYSKLIEYDITNSSVVNEIVAFDGRTQRISESCNNDSYIAFVVAKEMEEQDLKDIYLYDIKAGSYRIISSDINTGIAEDYSQVLNVSINGNSVFWLHPDLEGRKTEINQYDINTGEISIVAQRSFWKAALWNRYP